MKRWNGIVVRGEIHLVPDLSYDYPLLRGIKEGDKRRANMIREMEKKGKNLY